MHKKIYTGIGSRETPQEILNLMMRFGAVLGEHDWTLRSGHAPGADQHFEFGAMHTVGKMEIYLPWDGFEGAHKGRNKDQYYYVPSTEFSWHNEAQEIAAKFHPAWDRCGPGAKKLHTRNVYQVAGANLQNPSDLVICWTKDGKASGGTGQALRIAEYLKIPIFDLAIHTPEEVLEFINYGVIP